MKVSEAMSKDVCLAKPDQSIREAAMMMAQRDIGALPVADNDRLIGMITDRDIAVRGVAQGKGPETPIRQVMTGDVKYCFADDDLDSVCENMADIQVRRLPVVDREKHLVGILALGDIATKHTPQTAGRALEGISQPTAH